MSIINDEINHEIKSSDTELKTKIKFNKSKMKTFNILNNDNLNNDNTKDTIQIPNNTFTDIVLQEHQIQHVDLLNNKLSKYPLVCDFSAMGSGKSFTSSYICKNSPLNFKHAIIIGPLSIKNDWEKKKSIYGVPIHSFISYCSLRSVKGKSELSHGLLNRIDSFRPMTYKDERINVDVVEFKCTELYKKLVSEGLLLIIDEIQNIKNINAQFKACRELINGVIGDCDYINPPVNNSRILLLSGTPFDKCEQIPHFFRLTGVMKHDELCEYNIMTGVNKWTGFKDIIKLSKHINSRYTDNLVRLYENTGTHKVIIPACFDVFQQIIKPEISHSMPPVQLKCTINKLNAFYSLCNDTDKTLMIEGVSRLKKSLSYNENNDSITFTHGISMQAIQSSLQMIETAKIKTICNIVKSKLNENEFNKVVVCLNYTNPLMDLADLLKAYNPLVINGQTKISERGKMIDKFQQNDSLYRLIIANIHVISEGINLDDQDGSFPRFCIVNPNYSTIKLCQLSDRFKRSLTKSDSNIHFMFAKHCCELNILDALARKSAVMKETTPEQVEGGVKFPCDYDAYVEGNVDELNVLIKRALSTKKIYN